MTNHELMGIVSWPDEAECIIKPSDNLIKKNKELDGFYSFCKTNRKGALIHIDGEFAGEIPVLSDEGWVIVRSRGQVISDFIDRESLERTK